MIVYHGIYCLKHLMSCNQMSCHIHNYIRISFAKADIMYFAMFDFFQTFESTGFDLMFTCVCPYSSLFKRMLITELMFSEEWANLAIQMFLLHHKRKYCIFLSPHTTELWRGNWVCPMCVCACVCVYAVFILGCAFAPMARIF